MPVNGAKALHAATGMFAWTTAGVTAHGFAMFEPVPVTHLAIKQRNRQRAQPVREFFPGDQRLELFSEMVQMNFAVADLLHHRFELGANKLSALQRNRFPLPR